MSDQPSLKTQIETLYRKIEEDFFSKKSIKNDVDEVIRLLEEAEIEEDPVREKLIYKFLEISDQLVQQSKTKKDKIAENNEEIKKRKMPVSLETEWKEWLNNFLSSNKF